MSGRSHTYTAMEGQTVTFRVRAQTALGPTNWSAEHAYTALPAAPLLTLARGSGSGEITASWTAVANATGYELQQKTGAAAFADVEGVSGLAHTFTGRPGTSYTFRVRATLTGGGVTAWSTERSLSTGLPAPAAPTLTPAATSIAVAVEEVTGATSYEARIRTGTTGAWGDWTTMTNRGHTFTGLTSDTSYTVQVRARDADGPGGVSSAVGRTTLVAPAAAPTGLTLTPQLAIIGISWTLPARATHVEIRSRKGTTGDDWTDWTRHTGTSTSLINLEENTLYTVEVRGWNSGGGGPAASDTATTTTATAAPTGRPRLSLVLANITSLDITIGDVADAAWYEYQLGGTTGTWLRASRQSLSLTGLTANTVYTIYARAVNSQGAGPASLPAQFRTLTESGVPGFGISMFDVAGDAENVWVTGNVSSGGNEISLQVSRFEDFRSYNTVLDERGSIASGGAWRYTIPTSVNRGDADLTIYQVNRVYYVRARLQGSGGVVSPWTSTKAFVRLQGSGGTTGGDPSDVPEGTFGGDTFADVIDDLRDQFGEEVSLTDTGEGGNGGGGDDFGGTDPDAPEGPK